MIDQQVSVISLRDEFLSNMQRITGLSNAGRSVCITPIDGAYGLAGYMLVVNGSPPKGALLVQVESAENNQAFTLIAMNGKARRIGEKSPTALSSIEILRALNLPLHSGATVPDLIEVGETL